MASNTKNMNQSSDQEQTIPTLDPTMISRLDLFSANYRRHLNECKSLITFLGSFVDYESLRDELNNHIDQLINFDDYGI